MNGVCDKFCDDCVYLSQLALGNKTRCCNYFLRTGERRPCPAGKDCTVKVKLKVKRKKKWRET